MTDQFYKEKTEKITQLDNQFEADILREVLKDNDIPAVFKPYEDTAYGDLFSEHKGWGSVWAAKENRTAVEEFLAEIRHQKNVADGLEFDEELDEDALARVDGMDKLI